MSKELREFLQWWLKEAESDNPDYLVTAFGLCHNVDVWTDCNEEVCYELNKLLGNMPYPFGSKDYDEHFYTDTMHKCPKRLEWVRDVLAY